MPTARYRESRNPPRKGRPICCNIDPDAHGLLKAMVPNSKGMDLMLSELIRREARERLERATMVATLAAMHATGDGTDGYEVS